ncbi:hypothetical protein Tco_0388596 [Tanacetum coccineum]
MKQKKLDSRISSDYISKPLYVYDTSNVESKTGEKKILLENETSSFETKIVELETILAQQRKDFEDAKVDFQTKRPKSKLASQDLLSNQKEYNEFRTSYNALKAKFDPLNRDKGKSSVTNFLKLTKAAMDSPRTPNSRMSSDRIDKMKQQEFVVTAASRNSRSINFSKIVIGYSFVPAGRCFDTADRCPQTPLDLGRCDAYGLVTSS